jgi:hypothetical protein
MDKMVNSLLSAGVNPLSTPAGQLIDKATDQMTPDANLELYFEICDFINVKEENAKDAMKAIRKKMSMFSGKNWSVVLKLLLLVETCSNNCNKRFQILIANKDFLQELKNMIGPKLNPPLSIQEKVLYLIQHWTTIFSKDADFKSIESFYNELRSKGVDFPLYDPENTNTDLKNFTTTFPASLDTSRSPASNVSNINRQTQHQTQQLAAMGISPSDAVFQRLPTEAFNPSGTVVKLNDEQTAKLNSELDIVDSNVQVLNEILTELEKSPDQTDKDLSLLLELNKTCREMQKRVTQLIGNISNENVIGELLRVNDDLNNVFLRYERFERGNATSENLTASTASARSQNSKLTPANNQNNQTATAAAAATPTMSTVSGIDKPLIDFNDDLDDTVTKKPSVDLLNSNMKSLNLNNKKTDDDFTDMNAFLHDENEIKEMEEWLKSQGHKLNESNSNTNITGKQKEDETKK